MAKVYKIETGQVDHSKSDKEEDLKLLSYPMRRALALGGAALATVAIAVGVTDKNSGPKVVGHEKVAHVVKPGETVSNYAEGVVTDLHEQGYTDSLATVESALHVSTPGEGPEQNLNEVMPGDHITGEVPLDK